VAVTNERFVPDEILVRFNGGMSAATIANFARSQRLTPLGTHPLPLINASLNHFRITDRRTVPAVLAGLRGDARLAAAQPNYLYELRAGAPDDGAPGQYAGSKMHLAQAHALARGTGVLIALIDAGVDTTHAELRGSVAQGVDTVGGELAPHAHGTAMASAIVAHGRLLGVAPAARIVAVRAFDGADASARATTVRLLDGLQWSATSGARIINMSFTGPADAQLEAMIAAVRRKGLVLVAAAGNDGPTAPPDYPAAYPGVIAVTATDVDDRLLRVANHGSYVAVAAPGVDISVAASNGGYGFTTGTSVAAAHVSGLVALLLERNPRLTPDAVAGILMQTAKDLGPKGRDDEFGAGLVDAYAALLTQGSASAAR
jgi:subtilisin family serine protease